MKVYKLQNQSFPIRIKFHDEVQCLTVEAAVELAVSLLKVSGNENRLDPYPNGKSKGELLAIIDAKEAELARARNLLRDLSANLGDLGYYLQDHKMVNLKKIADNVANAMVFLAETSTVKS